MFSIGIPNPHQAAALSGIAAHLLFNRFEPRNAAALLFLVFSPPIMIASLCSSASLAPTSGGFGVVLAQVLSRLASVYIVYLFTLSASVFAYRLSPLHPLCRYPGPLYLRLSRFSALWVLLTGKQHTYYHKLHQKYGPYVRTGPNYIHISDAAAIRDVLGSPSFRKGARYDAIKRAKGTSSIHGISDPKEHAIRRRLWDKGLNGTALKGYEQLLSARTVQLVNILEQWAVTATNIDLYKWVSFFSFDFMGDLAYGGAFDLMKEGKDSIGILELSKLAPLTHEVAGTIPWIRPFYNMLPVPIKSIRHVEFAKQTVLRRIQRGPSEEVIDLFSYLIGEHDKASKPLSFGSLVSEASFAIVAGSDTTAITICNILYYLLTSPKSYERLQAEIDHVRVKSGGGPEPLSSTVLSRLAYLNAVINETLRLQPPVPNGAQRVVAGDVGRINNHVIPASTTVQISTYSVQRDPSNFSPYPDGFWPERWLQEEALQLLSKIGEESSYRLNNEAFFPFSYGPTACAGKALAMMEIRSIVSSILSSFHVEFAPGWNPATWEANLLDQFVLRGVTGQHGGLRMVLNPRS